MMLKIIISLPYIQIQDVARVSDDIRSCLNTMNINLKVMYEDHAIVFASRLINVSFPIIG